MPDANDATCSMAPRHDPEGTEAAVGATADFAVVRTPGHDITSTFPSDPERTPASVSIPGYEIESLLGRGGMGVVYKARHFALKRTVALKLILAGAHAGPQQLARFRIEAEAAARLPHPNIVQIYEVGDVDGHPYCALEYVEGGNLASKLNGKPLPAREAAKLVEVLSRAMQLAHSRNVVHRDLKPANILLAADGTPKISDFGLARQLDSDSGETQAGAVMGTPSYMAPEQASGHAHEAGPAADVYALGAILYDCLAGRPPFKGETVVETLDQVRTQEPKPPSHWQSNVPPDMDTICLKCLRKEPENRYASAAELAAELVRFQNGEPILARPTGRFERSVKWVKRNPVVTGAVVAVALALAAGTTVSYLKFRDAEEQREAADLATAEARREREAERWERYRSNLIAAGSAMQLHNVSAASASLEAAPEEHRGWEWRHYTQQLDTALDSRFVGTRIGRPRFSADGNLLALSTPENELRIWDVPGRKEIAKLSDLANAGNVCFSRDGKLVAYSRRDNTVEIRDVAGSRSRFVLQGATMHCTLPEFNRDSTMLAAGSYDRTIRVWDVATGKLIRVLPGHEAVVFNVKFSPDGRWLSADGRDNSRVRIWDLNTEKIATTLSPEGGQIEAVSFNPRGDRIVASECFPRTNIRMWDPSDGKLIAVLRGHTNEAMHYAFTSDGSRMATSSTDQTIRIWDGRTGAPIAKLSGHAGWVEGIAFSPDGKRIASGSQDQTVRLWDPETGAPLAILHGHTNDVLEVAWSADGSTITSVSGDGNIRWWDAKRAERYGVLRDHGKFVYSVAFHPDGERVASAAWDGTVRIWNATTSEQIALLPHPEESVVASVAFHPAGKLLATMCRVDGIRVWDVDSGKVVQQLPLPANHWQDSRLAFSPDGDWLACGDKHVVRVWSVKTWADSAVLSGHKDFVRDVVFAPDGRWLASASENSDPVVRIWDLTRKEQMQVLEGHTTTVYALAVSRDGKWLASGSMDGTVRLWDTATWKEAAMLKHGVNVYGLSFNPDGARLACACANNTIRLWDLATRQVVAELHGHKDYVHQVAWSPDGTRLVSGSGDKTLRVWDSLSSRERAKRAGQKPQSNP